MLFLCSSILLTIWPLIQVGFEMVGHLVTNASELWLFQMAVWLWNMGCQRRRGSDGERKYKGMAVIIGIQCYFHVAAFY